MPTLIPSPAVVAAAGNKPKRIEEYVGRVNSGHAAVSVARMVSPEGWVEPGQRPEFEEITVVLRGCLRVESDRRRARRPRGPGDRRPSRRVDSLQQPGARRRRIRRDLPAGVLDGRRPSGRRLILAIVTATGPLCRTNQSLFTTPLARLPPCAGRAGGAARGSGSSRNSRGAGCETGRGDARQVLCARRCSDGTRGPRRQRGHGRRTVGDEPGGARRPGSTRSNRPRLWRQRRRRRASCCRAITASVCRRCSHRAGREESHGRVVGSSYRARPRDTIGRSSAVRAIRCSSSTDPVRTWFNAVFPGGPTPAQQAGVAGHRRRRLDADSRADRIGQDAGGVSLVPEPADVSAGAGRARSAAACSTSRRSRRWPSTSSATCARRSSASPGRRCAERAVHLPAIAIRTGDTPPPSAPASSASRRTS